MRMSRYKMTYYFGSFGFAVIASSIIALIWVILTKTTGMSVVERSMRPLLLGIAIWAPYVVTPIFAQLYQYIHWELYEEPYDSNDWLNAAMWVFRASFIGGLVIQPFIHLPISYDRWRSALVPSLAAAAPSIGIGTLYVLIAGLRSDKPLASNAMVDAQMIRTSVAFQSMKKEAAAQIKPSDAEPPAGP